MIQLTENDLANTQPHDQHTVEAEYADGSFCVYATHPQASAQVAAALLAQGAIRAWINGEPAGKTVIDADDPGDFEQLRRATTTNDDQAHQAPVLTIRPGAPGAGRITHTSRITNKNRAPAFT